MVLQGWNPYKGYKKEEKPKLKPGEYRKCTFVINKGGTTCGENIYTSTFKYCSKHTKNEMLVWCPCNTSL